MIGPTKAAVLEAMAELCEELGRAPRSSRTYTVAEAVSAWLDDGLPGRSGRTKTIYKDGLRAARGEDRPCAHQIGAIMESFPGRPVQTGQIRRADSATTGTGPMG